MQRPTSATVFGILNILFAVFGLLGLIASLFLFSAARATGNPVGELIQNNPTYAMWMKISIPLGIIATTALLVSGIGLFLVKEWARKLSIGYAIYAIIMSLIGTVVNFLFLVRPMLEQASRQQGPEAAGAIGGAIGGAVGGCFGMIYPILLLIFMTRPKLVAAFQGTPPTDIPPVSPPM